MLFRSSGEPRIGFRLPLLRDGSIDRRRANLIKARLDKELADPIIHRQQIDFIRAATAGYYGWLAAGERLRLSEALLRIARERMSALRTQADSGLIPRIVLTDNQRLIVSRELAVVQARRRFEAAGLALSYAYDLPTGPLIVCTFGAVLFLAWIIFRVASRGRSATGLAEAGPGHGL